MNIVIMGPPGCGKGTQADGIVEAQKIVHISTGDMLRVAVKSGSPLGRKVEAVMAAGELVSDDLMIEIIKERLQQVDAQGGWLLDGFPRTMVQAEALPGLLDEIGQTIDAVVALDVPDEEIVSRLSGRMTCRECGKVTSVGNLVPDRLDVCPACGKSALYQRDDDKEETVRRRLEVFRAQTWPATDKLGEKYSLKLVAGLGDPAEVAQRIAGVLV